MADARFGADLAAPLAHAYSVPAAVTFDEAHDVRAGLVDDLHERAVEVLGRLRARAAVDGVAEFFRREGVMRAVDVDCDETDRAIEAVDGADFQAREHRHILFATMTALAVEAQATGEFVLADLHRAPVEFVCGTAQAVNVLIAEGDEERFAERIKRRLRHAAAAGAEVRFEDSLFAGCAVGDDDAGGLVDGRSALVGFIVESAVNLA